MVVVAHFLADAPQPSWAAVSTAVASGITAIGGLILAFAVLIPSLRVTKETHRLVNQTHTDALNYQNALIRALRAKGIEVPVDQSLPNGDIQSDATVGNGNDDPK